MSLVVLFLAATLAAGALGANNDSPEVLAWDREIAASGESFKVVLNNMRQIVPSSNLPAEVQPEVSSRSAAMTFIRIKHVVETMIAAVE